MMDRRTFLATAAFLPALHGCALTRRGAASAIDPALLGASTACVAGYPLLDALRTLRRLGFQTLEMIAYTGASHSVGDIPGFDFYQATEREREEVYEATRPFKHISAHMPFAGLSLVSSDDAARQSAVRQVERAMDGLAFLEGEMAVVHAGWPDRGQSYQDVWTQVLDTFRSLGDYAGSRGLRVGLETMQPASAREYTDLVFEIDHPMVGATVDTGHIRGASDIELPPEERDSTAGSERVNEVLLDVVRGLEEKLFHFHLSDVRSSDWRDHIAVGTGIIDFPSLFAELKKRRYDGLLVFELEEADQLRTLRESKAYVEELMAG